MKKTTKNPATKKVQATKPTQLDRIEKNMRLDHDHFERILGKMNKEVFDARGAIVSHINNVNERVTNLYKLVAALESPDPPAEVKEEQWVPKVGDWVVCLAGAGGSGDGWKPEGAAQIANFDYFHGDPTIKCEGREYWFKLNNLRRATPAEVSAHLRAVEKAEEERKQAEAKAEELAIPLVICKTRVRYAGHEGVYLGPHGTQHEIARPNGTGTWTVSVCDRDSFTVIPD